MEPDVPAVADQLENAGADRGRGVARRRADLQGAQAAVDDGDEVRERATGVDPDEDRAGPQEAGFSLAPEDFDASAFVSLFAVPPSDGGSVPPSFLPEAPLPLRA